jgi:hypothetical protein
VKSQGVGDAMNDIKFSLRTLFHGLTAMCVVCFWVGAVVQQTPISIMVVGLTAMGLPYCYFVFRNSRGRGVGRFVITICFGVGWIWVASYLAVLSAACSPDPGSGLDALDNALAFSMSVTLFPLTALVFVLLLSCYSWAYHDADFESQIEK